MAAKQGQTTNRPKRGILAKPLEALVFLLPLLAFSEIMAAAHGHRVIAFDLVYSFFELFGRAGVWAPPLTVVVILLTTQIASGERWSVRLRSVAAMYLEAAALSVPLLLLGLGLVEPLGVHASSRSLPDQIALSLGAGIYEELVFRLVIISLVMMVGVDLLRRSRSSVAVAAVLISSVAFAAHHYLPIGQEPFDLTSFLFRSAAGVYLALVFWFRGYGSAAGCHAAYNVSLLFLAVLGY